MEETGRQWCSLCQAQREWLVLRGNSHAVLRENSHAVLRENSHAVLRGNSHAVLRENSHAVLRGNSHAELRENSHAESRNPLAVIILKSAQAHASGHRIVNGINAPISKYLGDGHEV